jgi:hypothetical protein
MRSPTLLALLLAASACTTPATEHRSVLPDDRLLIDGFDDGALARGLGETSDYYTLTRQVTHEINGGVGEVLGLIDAITAFDPTWTDETSTALWGPWLDDGLYGRLWVAKDEAGAYGWAIELRPETSTEDDWVGVLTGQVEAGADELHSEGWFVMDLTAIEGAGAGDGTTGTVACEYELFEDGATARVAFGEIAEDGGVPEDGAYKFEHTRGEGGLMDVAVTGDISEPANGTSELLIVRSRWTGDGAGRADATVTGGDLGPLVYTETDCWDQGHKTVFFENNFELLTEGDASRCAFAEASFNEAR